MLAAILASFLSPVANANIQYSIEEFTGLMEEVKVKIGIGYSIESISRTYSQEYGHGFKIILDKLLGVGNTDCYRAVADSSDTEFRPKLTKIDCSEKY